MKSRAALRFVLIIGIAHFSLARRLVTPKFKRRRKPRGKAANFRCRRISRSAQIDLSSRVRGRKVKYLDAALAKNFLAALVERVAATVLHALEQCLHQLKPLHPVAEFRDFSLGELMPAFRWRRPG